VEKKWNTDAAQRRIIYINVVFFILGFLDLSTLILSLSQQLKELGWGFFSIFLKFYLEYWKISMFITLLERAAVKHTFIRYWQFQGLHLP